MQEASAFMGEIEFDGDIPPDPNFGQFERLPNIDKIHELAQEYSSQLELMPYQKVGEPIKLLVSIYLKSKLAGGRVIAVMTRSDYPQEASALAEMMQTAIGRLDFVSHLAHQFEEESISSARDALEQLHKKIIVQWSREK